MNWLEFIASLVGSLAWPVSAAIIALIFRDQIKAIFERLDELGYGDWKLKLGKDLKEAEEAAEELPPPPAQEEFLDANDAVAISNDRFSQLVEISPNAAIVEEWINIEDRIIRIAEKLGHPTSSVRNIVSMIRLIGEHPMFPSSLVDLLNELRQIRNRAAHLRSVTAADAFRFKRLSDRVTPFLIPGLFDQN